MRVFRCGMFWALYSVLVMVLLLLLIAVVAILLLVFRR